MRQSHILEDVCDFIGDQICTDLEGYVLPDLQHVVLILQLTFKLQLLGCLPSLWYLLLLLLLSVVVVVI